MIFQVRKNLKLQNKIKESLCYISEDFETELKDSVENKIVDESYEFPDGTVIKIGSERFRAPEILFQPELIGVEIKDVPNLINDSILNWNYDIRRDLFCNIVLSGGSTMFEGICNRISYNLNAIAPLNYKTKIICPPGRKYSTWIGCSILASLTTFQDMWIKKSEYDESGPRIVNQKCL